MTAGGAVRATAGTGLTMMCEAVSTPLNGGLTLLSVYHITSPGSDRHTAHTDVILTTPGQTPGHNTPHSDTVTITLYYLLISEITEH